MALDEEIYVLRDYILSREVVAVINDPLLVRSLRDSLRVAVESMLDICKHFVATFRLGIVREYKDLPLKLSGANMMDGELASKLVDFIRLRNVVVHGYAELNHGLLYSKAGELVEEVGPTFRGWLSKVLKEKASL